jgi:hypothetical protein
MNERVSGPDFCRRIVIVHPVTIDLEMRCTQSCLDAVRQFLRCAQDDRREATRDDKCCAQNDKRGKQPESGIRYLTWNLLISSLVRSSKDTLLSTFFHGCAMVFSSRTLWIVKLHAVQM